MQVDISSGGRQTVRLTDPKTGAVVGEVSFEVSSEGGMGGGGGALPAALLTPLIRGICSV